MKLLIVENHEQFLAAVRKEFLSEYEITAVATVAEAVAAFRNGSYDLVLTDYDLDDGKGAEVVIFIREQNSAIPIIAISAHEKGNDALLETGANAVCGKLNFREIDAVIHSVIAK